MGTAKEGPVVSHDDIVYVLKISHCYPLTLASCKDVRDWPQSLVFLSEP